MYPFAEQYDEGRDKELITAVRAGSRDAADELIRLHERFIYNVALKLVREPNGAADLTQEVLIKMLTKLAQYQFKGSFRAWLYRMVMNHFIDARRSGTEKEIYSFEELGVVIDTLHNDRSMTAEEQTFYHQEIIDVRNKCMASTLLCLDRQQRLVLILGAIFNLRSAVAAGLLDITPENFRKQLQRAKEDLFQFMDKKCGLINPNNPCRCHKKTKGFILEGKVDPATRQFKKEYRESIESVVNAKNNDLDQLMEGRYLRLFVDQPYEEMEPKDKLIGALLDDPEVKRLFIV